MMACHKIRRSLSGYMDGELDSRTVRSLEEHLKGCRGCREEHSSLKRVVGELRSLEPVKVPKDFLDRVNERIERRSWVDLIRDFISFPGRMRVPLELTASFATALFIFLILNTALPVRQEIPISAVSSEVEPIQLSVLLDKEAGITRPTERNGAKVRFNENDSGKAEGKSLQLVNSGKAKGLDGLSESELRLEGLLRGDQGDAEVSNLIPGRSGISQVVSDPGEIDIISKIHGVVSLLGGRVLSEEYESGTGLPKSLSLEIKDTDYTPFLSAIGNLGTVQGNTPSSQATGNDRLQIQLLFQSSR